MQDRSKSSSINLENLFKHIKTILISIFSTMVGYAIGWLFDKRFLLSLIIFSILGILALIAWIFSIMYEKKVSILEMLNKCIRRKRYQEAVRIGYSVSRAFFLSDRNEERYRISQKVYQALEHMEGAIIINGSPRDVKLLKAQLLIDDCGWSLYLLKPFENQQIAASRIKAGIKLCLSVTRELEPMTYNTVYRGLRHLFAMVIQNLDEVPLEALKNDPKLLDDYIKDIKIYGGLLGYVLNDRVMMDKLTKNKFQNVFSEITGKANNSNEYLKNLRDWCISNLNGNQYLWFSSYNPRIWFSLGMIKICKIKLITNNIKKYFNHAKENAIKMTLGYSTQESDCEWLESTLFADDIKNPPYDIVKQPDPERLVKGFVLLGSVALASDDYRYWLSARDIFTKAIEESKRVNRVDSFIRAQIRLISAKEMICYKELKNGELDKKDSQGLIIQMIDSLKTCQKETQEFLGHSNPKIESFCKAKEKEYKTKLKSYREHSFIDFLHRK